MKPESGRIQDGIVLTESTYTERTTKLTPIITQNNERSFQLEQLSYRESANVIDLGALSYSGNSRF